MADRRSAGSSRRSRGDESVGSFVIGAEIGKGSFAQVYVGKHKVRTKKEGKAGLCLEPWYVLAPSLMGFFNPGIRFPVPPLLSSRSSLPA